MNKYILFGVLSLVSVSFMACSDDEEILEPTKGYVDNKFAVPDDATGPEAEIRRNFYAKTGSHLLFNDLLSHEYVGKNNLGEDVYADEYIDFEYSFVGLGGDSSKKAKFDYIEDTDKMREAAQLVESYISPHLEGSTMKPFSYMLVTGIVVKEFDYDIYEDVDVNIPILSCFRCLAVDVNDWLGLDDNDKAAYGLTILSSIAKNKLDYRLPEADEFYDLSSEYSGEYLSDLDEDWDRTDMSVVYEYGYITYVKSKRSAYNDYLPYVNEDYNSFIEAVITKDEQEFFEEFEDYPIVLSKYSIVKNILASYGYKF